MESMGEITKSSDMQSVELAKRIRLHALDMVNRAHASHIGGILSAADIIAVLYAEILNVFPENPNAPERDRFIMSKGHCGAAVYAALAERGFFPVETLRTYGDDGGNFSCHISHKRVPGVEISTGSLGHGVCVACGMALDAKIKGRGNKVYSVIGDGECNEGTIWEMAMFSSQYALDNFVLIIDRNGMQATGFCNKVMNMEPLGEKWRAFGWHVTEAADGHDHEQLKEAFKEDSFGKPKVIIANTIKGKGISFMENELLWHYRDPQGELYQQAKNELMEAGL